MNDSKKITKAKVHKYIEFLTARITLLVKQRKFEHNGVVLKYIYRKKSADSLVVVLSSCTRPGIKARYNYMRTLKGIRASQLFILDDFFDDKRGSYYVGKNYTFDEETATKSLIQKIYDEQNPLKLAFCGSSKGGWAALNFGLQFKNAYIITGAPQYLLAKYLKAGFEDRLKYILGEITEEREASLNDHLRNRIKNNPYSGSQHIYLHYSDKEHTYEEHIQYLLKDLKDAGYDLTENIADYTDHSDIAYYFPSFLVNTLSEILKGEKTD